MTSESPENPARKRRSLWLLLLLLGVFAATLGVQAARFADDAAGGKVAEPSTTTSVTTTAAGSTTPEPSGKPPKEQGASGSTGSSGSSGGSSSGSSAPSGGSVTVAAAAPAASGTPSAPKVEKGFDSGIHDHRQRCRSAVSGRCGTTDCARAAQPELDADHRHLARRFGGCGGPPGRLRRQRLLDHAVERRRQQRRDPRRWLGHAAVGDDDRAEGVDG